jgi:transposase-like protein
MSQHFLLSAKARTLSVTKVARMSHEEAARTFRALRWANNDGNPVCPACGCTTCYEYASRPIFKCKGCGKQFSVTSGTLFASRKLPIRDYLLAIAIFVNAVKGISALQLGRDLSVQYKTAFVLAHKLREAMMAEQNELMLSGEVEVDGAYFGGHIRPENRKADRRDRRLLVNQTGKRRVVVVMRERGGRTITGVYRYEGQAVPTILDRVARGSTIMADEASSWDDLHAVYAAKRINHSIAFSDDGACTNQAESYFSRLRRAEWGQHHHLSGQYLACYASEMAWREDYRRRSNGEQFTMIAAGALNRPVSRVWAGYWQRAA